MKAIKNFEEWITARKRYRLSHAHVQMAREIGLNPAKLGKIGNHRQEPWKEPLPNFIEEIYEKRFGRTRPERVLTLEEALRTARKKKEADREAKRLRKAARDEAAMAPPSLAEPHAERMIGIAVAITRFVLDHYPGFVECEFTDAAGVTHRIVEKIPVITQQDLDSASDYPCPGVIACEILEIREDGGRTVVRVSTERPWAVESLEGVSGFEVSPTIMVEWEWGSSESRRPWSGAALAGPVNGMGLASAKVQRSR